MREIKFRAWDKEQNNMWVWEKLIDKQCTYLNSKYFIAMQYTGLKDKNEVEIYEGDIVKVVEDKNKKVGNEPHQFKYGDIAKVEWNDVNLAYYLVNEKLEDVEIPMDYYGAWSDWNWLEVIGNIYENSELIK